MYGTIALMHAKPGHEDQLLAVSEVWWKQRVGTVDGAVSAEIRRSDSNPDQFFMIVTFSSKEQYTSNAEDPEQDAWYRQLVEHLTGEPQWFDGEIVAGYEALRL
jgi:quinol monooxygenase YgiN